jgi:hypothetical protein
VKTALLAVALLPACTATAIGAVVDGWEPDTVGRWMQLAWDVTDCTQPPI